MKSEIDIKKIQTEELKGIPIEGYWYRNVSIEFISHPLGGVGSILGGGRYNLPDSFEVLYMAPDPHTAIEEAKREPFDKKMPPQLLITAEIKTQVILNLEDKAIINALGIIEEKLFKPWRYPKYKEAYTQALGRIIYGYNIFEGIRYPSAKIENKYNLAIFPNRLRKNSEIKVYDPNKIIEQVLVGKLEFI